MNDAMPGLRNADPAIFLPPAIKGGSLDVLLDCSEGLMKLDNIAESITTRVLGLLEDVSGQPRAELSKVQVSGQARPMDCYDYLRQFQWDDAKYNSSRPIKVIMAHLQKELGTMDDMMKRRLQEYGEVKSKFTTVDKKRSGNLTTKPLGDIVTPWSQATGGGEQRLVDTEHLTTLFVVMPKSDHSLWEKEYWNLDGSKPGEGMVVPGSSSIVAKEDELLLCSVVLFKRVVDDFKSRARSKKWTVREYDPSTELSKEELATLEAHMKTTQQKFSGWLTSAFSEAFMAWTHVKALRLYDEALLRYGLPPLFAPVIVRVNASQEKSLRSDLGSKFKDRESKYGADDSVRPTHCLPWFL